MPECRYNKQGRCTLAENLYAQFTGEAVPIEAPPATCERCVSEFGGLVGPQTPLADATQLAALAVKRDYPEQFVAMVELHKLQFRTAARDGGRGKPMILGGMPDTMPAPGPGEAAGPLGPGGQLKLIFTAAGFPSCSFCNGLARDMDHWGVEGCRERRDEIVEVIVERARGWAESAVANDASVPFLKRALMRAPNFLKRWKISKSVGEAIEAAAAASGA